MNAPLQFKDEAELAAMLDSLHETTADGAVTNRKWEAAQRARRALLAGARQGTEASDGT